ncbi:hypothetical protein CEQ90_01195 [Lewinellaceae bacterium SD302]|nr:hypothetical protein CEQ90_01195 [Lewinellaceae bacterium SD302]
MILLFTLYGCQDNRSPEERYAAAMEEARTTEERTDDIFLGLEFGMRPKAFFDHCTVLNQQQKIVEGDGGKMAQLELEGLDDEASLSFAPKFSQPGTDSARLFALNFFVRYKAWAPWNKEHHSLPLLRDLTEYFIDEYGEGFVALPHEEFGRVVTQVTNNRRITLWIEDTEKVYGRFVDLSVAPDDPLALPQLKALPGNLIDQSKSK